MINTRDEKPLPKEQLVAYMDLVSFSNYQAMRLNAAEPIPTEYAIRILLTK